MIAAIHDLDYFEEMWRITPIWKRILQDLVAEAGFRVNENSPLWVPFVYVDCGNEEIAERADRVAFEAGYPVRWCKSFGQPCFLRLGVRLPKYGRGLVNAWIEDRQLSELLREFAAKKK
jgi:histidinol-phosphate/aromatic aminotransferase/cobyric acid decarboxylase-like protein